MTKERIKVNLYRYWKNESGNVGIVDVPGMAPLFSVELPWKNNRKNVSCIPAANYRCVRCHSDKNDRWKEAFMVTDVPGRSEIIFGHIANKPRELLGCVAFGMFYPRVNYVSDSAAAIDLWMTRMKGVNQFKLSIYEFDLAYGEPKP